MRPEKLYLVDIVEAADAIEWPIVWVAATKDAPALRERISRLLKDEYGLDRKGS